MEQGFIKLHRQLREWEWYTNTNVKSLFIHCLLSANFKDKKWQGHTIKRGQFATSLKHLEVETGLSIQNIRTSFAKLEKTGELTRKSMGNFTLVTIVNFDTFQHCEDSNQHGTNTVLTQHQHGTNTELTSNQQQLKNEKKDKNEKKKYSLIAEFQKIKKGEQMAITELDKNFHFKLFPEGWTDNFKNEVLTLFRYLESCEDMPKYWGKTGTISSQLKAIKQALEKYSEQKIIDGFDLCMRASKKSWHYYIPKVMDEKKQNKPKNDSDTFSFDMPIFNGT